MNELENKVESYVTRLFEEYMNTDLVYHNLSHTRQVVRHASEISQFYELGPNDQTVIRVAAWFHDVGHLFGEIDGHEERAIRVMQHFLSGLAVPDDFINEVAGCIRATRIPCYPENFNEQVICDADSYHLGTTYFEETDIRVKAEILLRGGSVDHWDENTLAFLRRQRYFTSYCRMLLDAGKENNIVVLQTRITAGNCAS